MSIIPLLIYSLVSFYIFGMIEMAAKTPTSRNLTKKGGYGEGSFSKVAKNEFCLMGHYLSAMLIMLKAELKEETHYMDDFIPDTCRLIVNLWELLKSTDAFADVKGMPDGQRVFDEQVQRYDFFADCINNFSVAIGRRRDPRYLRSLQLTLTDMTAFIANSS
jgi:hypothetical protein